AQYGPDPSDPSRPVRSQIQNFVEFNIDGNKLTAIVYEIDQSKNDGEPYVIDSFGLMNTLEGEREEMPKTGDNSKGIMLVAGSILALLGVIIVSKTKNRKA
ncbi:MAG: phosphohydrolase, partial [Herbinix sp.]|nr:phosphohydrolase [Herbinix sp.]